MNETSYEHINYLQVMDKPVDTAGSQQLPQQLPQVQPSFVCPTCGRCPTCGAYKFSYPYQYPWYVHAEFVNNDA